MKRDAMVGFQPPIFTPTSLDCPVVVDVDVLVIGGSQSGVAAAVSCAGRDVGAIRATYDDGEEGQPLALVNSMSLLEVAVKGGKASDVLGIGVGAEVRVSPRA